MLKLLSRRGQLEEGSAPASAVNPPPGDDLSTLVASCLAGKRAAERTLLLTLAPSMLQMVRRVLGAGDPEVEDTLQEATMNLLSALPTFRATCTTRHFACRVAVLTALKARRRRRAGLGERSMGELDQDDLGASEEPGPGEQLQAASRRSVLRKLLDELPDAQALALVLHCVSGMTVEEVAATTQSPLETARSRLRLAKAALRKRIAGDPATAELLEVSP